MRSIVFPPLGILQGFLFKLLGDQGEIDEFYFLRDVLKFNPFPQQVSFRGIQGLVGNNPDINIGIRSMVTAGAGPEEQKGKIISSEIIDQVMF